MHAPSEKLNRQVGFSDGADGVWIARVAGYAFIFSESMS